MIGPTNALTVTGTVDPQGVTVGSDTKPVKIVNGVATMVANDLVDTATAQTIVGKKKFTSSSAHAFTSIFNGSFEDASGSYPPDTRYAGLAIQDRNDHTLVQLDSEFDSSGNSVLGLRCFKAGQSEIDLYMTNASNNTRYARLINQRSYSASNTNDIVTIGSLQASTDVVHTAGNETIGGVKTFNDGINAYPQGWHNLYEGGDVAQGSYTKIATINNPSNIGYNAIIEFMAGGNNGLEYGRLAISGANSQVVDSGTCAWIERTTGVQWNKILFDEDCVVIATKSDGTRDILVYKRDLYGGVVYRTVMENSYGSLLSKSSSCIEYVTPVAVNLADYASTYTPKLGSIEGLDYATLMDAQATQNALDGYLPMVRTTDYQVITGPKVFDGIPGSANTRNSNIDVTSPPENDIIVGQWQFLDVNNTVLGNIMGVIAPDGSTYINANVRNKDGTYKAIRLITSD